MAQPSDITLGVDEAQMGSRVFITIQRHDPAAVQDLTMTVNDTVVTQVQVTGSSFIWEVPDCTLLCRDQKSAQCQILCETRLHGAFLGSRLAFLVLTLPDPVRLEPANLVLGSEVTLEASPGAKGFTMDYMLEVNGIVTPIAAASQSCSLRWTPPYKVAGLIPTLQKAPGKLRVLTYNGSYLVGDVETAVTVEVPENEVTRPKIRELTLSVLPGTAPEGFRDLYIRGKTGVKADYQVDWTYSQASSVVLTLGAGEYPEGQIPVLDRAGLQTLTLKVRDQRGFTGEESRDIQVLPYEKPRILPYAGQNQVICQRADGAGQLTPQGQNLAIRAGRRFARIPETGENRNRCTLRYRIRNALDPAFGPWVPILQPEDPENQVSLLLADLVADRKASYRVELSALDTMGEEHRLEFSVLTEAVSFALYDGVDGAAFGKYPEQAHVVDLAPHMTLQVRGTLLVQGEQWQDLGLSSQVEPSAYAVGRQEDTGCFLRVINGNRAAVSFNCSGSFQNRALVINRVPIPPKLRPKRKVTALCLRDQGAMGVTVDTEGVVQAESLLGPSRALWMDGNIEYFL